MAQFRLPTFALAAAGISLLLLSPSAFALEGGEVGGHRLTLELTETAVLNYNVDNRNSRTSDIGSRVDDNWGEWRNRFNVQATWWRFVFGLRLDSSVFFHTPNPNKLGDEDLANRPPPAPGEVRTPEEDRNFRNERVQAYGRELSNRYLNSLYPAKVFLSYSTPQVEATVGDVYAQFGRGLVLSVRKIDELAVDTTIRGGKLVIRPPLGGGAKLSTTLMGGYLNPLRIDETTGRVLQAPEQWMFAAMPAPTSTAYLPDASASYVPDRIMGASVEGGLGGISLGVHGVQLDRPSNCALYDAPTPCTPYQNEFIRGANTVRNASTTLSIPDIQGWGSLYLEAAYQKQLNDHPAPGTYDPEYIPRSADEDISGHALYGAFSANAGPFTFSFEGKHYRKFFPLQANVKMSGPGRTTEFQLLQYSAPPTTLPVYVDTENNYFNTCVTGGRGRLDARVTDDLLVYGWLGRYASWAEQGSPSCETDALHRNDVWDGAVGMEATYEQKRSHVFAWLGARDDQYAKHEESELATSSIYYRETYVRYDLVKRLTDRFSLQWTGLSRHRHYQAINPIPWWEGENYVALQWSPKLTFALGHEYKSAAGDPGRYFNGSLKWRFDSDTSLRIFVGQQRGALRCISGVCRQFPPFEGAKAELVMRF